MSPRTTGARLPMLLSTLVLAAGLPGRALADDYAGMLGYLNQAYIGDRALAGASGAIALNQAAGDLNQQANLIGMAQGAQAEVHIDARNRTGQDRVRGDALLQARAHIEGRALQGASGVATINQASGIGNTMHNIVQATLAREGIRESDDAALAAASVPTSTGGQGTAGDGNANGIREAGVSASALRGFEGVLQLNQIAGVGNDTANMLGMAVQGDP